MQSLTNIMLNVLSSLCIFFVWMVRIGVGIRELGENMWVTGIRDFLKRKVKNDIAVENVF